MSTKEVKFFSGRRQIHIGDFTSLMTSGGERRVKIPVSVQLSGNTVTGTPDWILDGYSFVVKDDSPYYRSPCKDMKFEGMSISFFTSDQVKRKMQGVGALNGCTFDKFAVERVGEGEKSVVLLNFIAYAPCSREIILWCYEQQRADIFAEFDSTQASLAYEGEEEEEEDTQGELPIGDEDGEESEHPNGFDPNDDPSAPIPGDKRSVTKPGDKPSLRGKGKKK